MALKDKVFLSGVWTVTDVLADNVSGTPLFSAELTGIGEEISDDYTLTVSARSGGTGTVTVTASANNPYNGKVKTLRNFNSTTEYTDVIPGLTLVFATAGANGNTATVKIGRPYGAFDASGVGAGVPTAGVKHQIANTGAADVANAVARLLPQVIQVPITNQLFSYIGPFAEGATEKTAGGGSNRVMPYALTASGVSGSNLNLLIDGVVFAAGTLRNLSTGAAVSGTGIFSDNAYQVISGPLEGLLFIVNPAVANSDKANIMIFSSRFVQIAADIAGVEGTYGTADVDLTQSGQATGVILATSGVAYYWVRFLVPSGANSESNPYPCNIAIAASESTSAGWEE